jgi:hypothetical protein
MQPPDVDLAVEAQRPSLGLPPQVIASYVGQAGLQSADPMVHEQ